MKNKKIIIALVIIILVSIIFGVYKVRTSYLFNEDGTITDGQSELINHLKSIENKEERWEQINFSLEQNIINEEQANELYWYKIKYNI